jgi:hypothetical protein
MRQFWRRLLYLFRPRRLEADLAEELAFHRAMKAAELGAEDNHAEGGRDLNLTLGSPRLAQEQSRDVWIWPWADALVRDLRLAIRGLRRDRAFTVVAIAMLALALGLNVTVFTVMDAFLFRGFPLARDNDRLVYLGERFPSGAGGLSYPDVLEWRAQAPAFDGLAYVASMVPITFREPGGPAIDLTTVEVSANTFGLLGVPCLLTKPPEPPRSRSSTTGSGSADSVAAPRSWARR